MHFVNCCIVLMITCSLSVGGQSCGHPGHVQHATTLPSKNLYEIGEKVFYTCIKPFQLSSGNGVLECMNNGLWNSSVLECLSSNTDATSDIDSVNEAGGHSDTIVIVIGVTVLSLLLIGIACWCLYKRLNDPTRSYMRTGQHSSMNMDNVFNLPPLKPDDLAAGAILADQLEQYVMSRHGENDQKFLEEFEEIQTLVGIQPTWEACKLNKDKNRYNNIVACTTDTKEVAAATIARKPDDHSRVCLRSHHKRNPSSLNVMSDYINANYVSSYHKPNAYIACQGPLPLTFSDFWRMVWDNDCATIVMITNLLEKGRRKCDQYWPHEGKEQYKYITVTLKRTEVFANYTTRIFSVKNTKLTRRNARSGERRVMQYHFTQWPDHGTPDYPLPLLTFIKRSIASNPVYAGPIVVHCSAGVGRSGTYIVIHSMMQMIQATGSLNINKFLRHIRKQRNHLVQTEDQYVFVHDALLEHIRSGNTERSLLQMQQYYDNLVADTGSADAGAGDAGNGAAKSGLEKQFMQVIDGSKDSFDYDFALRPVNIEKNRPGATLPVYRSRVPLFKCSSAEGSDYINASFVQGYRSSREFIITQLPMLHTHNDFWQLIWDHNSSIIITINDQQFDSESESYWPSADHSFHCPSFNVSFSSEATTSSSAGGDCDVTIRCFILEATKDDYVLEVKQFALSKWDTEQATFEQLDAVAEIVKATGTTDDPTVIQDRFGSTAAAQLACWLTMHCQLDNENSADVYQTAAVVNQMRPKVIATVAHLTFLYQAVLLEAKVRSNPTKVREERESKQRITNGGALEESGLRNDSLESLTDRSDSAEVDCLIKEV